MDNNNLTRLREVAKRQKQAEKELEQSIIACIKEMWRLSLPFHYETTTPELDEAVIGRDQ